MIRYTIVYCFRTLITPQRPLGRVSGPVWYFHIDNMVNIIDKTEINSADNFLGDISYQNNKVSTDRLKFYFQQFYEFWLWLRLNFRDHCLELIKFQLLQFKIFTIVCLLCMYKKPQVQDSIVHKILFI